MHYSLGFPPYRSGGLTKYCTDLMEQQIEKGHVISLLWPGTIKIISNKTKIKQEKAYKGKITSYEIINPLPVPLLNGIEHTNLYCRASNKTVYQELLKRIKPDVIHIHTFMGLHREFLQVAKEMKIKMIYTTHDYFGICPKVNLFYKGKICDDNEKCIKCIKCNEGSFSIKKIKIMQSPIYRQIRNSKKIRKVIKKFNKKIANTKKLKLVDDNKINDNKKYEDLRKYYFSMFKLIDMFHFNSKTTQEVYEKYLNIQQKKVIFLSHKNIQDKRKEKKFDKTLKITYMGPREYYKGYFLLKNVLDQLYTNGNNKIEFNIFFKETDAKKAYIKEHEEFDFLQQETIFNSTDLLIVPSLWQETFGFTLQEAISHAVPVIASGNVGAKELIENGKTGIILEDINQKSLYKIIKEIYDNRQILKNINMQILKKDNIILSFSKHTDEIIKLYQETN